MADTVTDTVTAAYFMLAMHAVSCNGIHIIKCIVHSYSCIDRVSTLWMTELVATIGRPCGHWHIRPGYIYIYIHTIVSHLNVP